MPPGRRRFGVPALLRWSTVRLWTKARHTITDPFPSLPQISCQAAFGQLAGGDGGSGGARTRHKSNEYGPETGLPSQIASQEPGTLGHDVARVVTAWAKLPAPLKAAILAIVDSVLTVNGGDK
jgi:hypothetical protein